MASSRSDWCVASALTARNRDSTHGESAGLARHLPPRISSPSGHTFMAGAGCTYCNLTGYRGRVAVYEILEIDRTLADAVRRGDLDRLCSSRTLEPGLRAARARSHRLRAQRRHLARRGDGCGQRARRTRGEQMRERRSRKRLSRRCSSSARSGSLLMSNFRYRGRSGRGDLITGRLEADDIDGVAARLLNLGITPLEIAPDAVHGASVQDVLQRLGAGRPTTADLVLFSRQMYSITKAGTAAAARTARTRAIHAQRAAARLPCTTCCTAWNPAAISPPRSAAIRRSSRRCSSAWCGSANPPARSIIPF